jgi:hypothetical protein
VRNVVVFQVEYPLGVLDDGGGVGGNEELNRLRHAVLGEEGTRLRAAELRSFLLAGYGEKTVSLGIVGDYAQEVQRAMRKQVPFRYIAGVDSRFSAPSLFGSSTSTKSTFNLRSVLTPINNGEPLRAATISSGK